MAEKRILYGVGTANCIDLDDKTETIAFGKLQDLTISFSSDSEEINGGDDPYPITEFPKTRTITVTAKDAMFDIDLFKFSQGAEAQEVKDGEMLEQIYFAVEEDGTITLPHTPVEGSVVVNGFTNGADASAGTEEEAEGTEGSQTDAKKTFTVAENKLTFDKSVAGETVTGYYYRKIKGTGTITSGYKTKFPKPFKFVHRIPVYDDNNQIVQQAQLTIYKAKSDNSLEINHAPQTAYAPQLSIKALDPKRADGKLWDYTIENVDPKDASAANMTI